LSPPVSDHEFLDDGRASGSGSFCSASEDPDSTSDDDMSQVAQLKPPSAPSSSSHHCRRIVNDFLNNISDVSPCSRYLALSYHLTFSASIVLLFVIDSTTKATTTSTMTWWSELLITVLWLVEFALRIWSCVENYDERILDLWQVRIQALSQPMMVLDIFSLISLIIDLCIESEHYRGVATLRMFRLLTMYRIERDFQIFGPVLVVIYDRRCQLAATFGIAIFVLCVFSVIMFYIEVEDNPQFNSVLMSMWWCTTALTTVGYGDIVPITPMGRVVASVVAFIGTGMFGLFAGILADGVRDAFKRDRRFSSDSTLARHHKALAVATASISAMPALDARLQRHEEEMQARLGNLQTDVDALRTEVQDALTLLRAIATAPRVAIEASLDHGYREPRKAAEMTARSGQA